MTHRYFSKFRFLVPWLPKATPSVRPQVESTKQYCNLKTMATAKTLKDFGYAFNAQGQLRKIGEDGQPSDEPFQFNVSDCHKECQAHYEEICEAMTDYVYHLLETEVMLTRLPVPEESSPENGTFIYASNNYDRKDSLMILIHGNGPVRAGQWARKLIINENLDAGTQIPYIKKALERNYGVMVLNTNDNFQKDGKKIAKSSNAEEHASYIWSTYVSKTKASSIMIVAHSYGGIVTVTLANQYKKNFEERVKAIAFTDSVHGYSNIKISKFLKQVSRNWISSSEPLDTPMITPDFDITRVSAGHPMHDMTSYKCIDSVFTFIEERLSESCKK